MIKLTELTLMRGALTLFERVSLTIYAGQKTGLVGANGSGKTSFFELVRGRLQPDAGAIELTPKLVIASVAQETEPLPAPAIEHVLAGDSELKSIETALAGAGGAQLAELHARFAAIDGYSARARAAKLMAGLGFSQNDLERPVADFSGGWRVRLNLARALMCRADLLLLDEPTNHLDLDAVIWLEQWLKDYPGTLLLISHDRDFLDRIVDHTVHIEHRSLKQYRGNYSAFEAQRAAHLAQQQALYEKQQRTIAHMQSFVDRFRAKASKARQAQSRLKALQRMEIISAAQIESPFSFQFDAPPQLPNPLLKLDAASAGYGASAVLKNIKITLQADARIGLLGPNGAGKSTFIKLLAGELPPIKGRLEQSSGLRIGYFAQHQLEQLRADWNPLQHLQQLSPERREQQLRDYLGGFGFGADKTVQNVAPFSGGEKARLVLALLIWQRPNLLLLDEPSNHLDLEMRHALSVALQGFAGASVLVSHDRHLLRTCCDTFLLVSDGKIEPFSGDLDDYKRWLERRLRGGGSGQVPAEETKPAGASRREQRRIDAQKRDIQAKQQRPLKQRAARIEQIMERLSGKQQEIKQLLASADIYNDAEKERLKEVLLEQGYINRELEALEQEWLEIQETLETDGQGQG